uniref:Structural maintenance of chromosomes protein 5 n=1 Tax=Piliocolobus tephrosceles TaxID=591936 RepID=A0A8C9GYN3_9PRIM
MVFNGPIELKPKAGINLIAAANASGKSSIVCALVFVLGYNANILSRNKELINYIKEGETESYIKIEIFLNGHKKKDRVKIKRDMLIVNNKVETIWKLDNKKVNYNDILDIRKKLNVHLDNLITFMPQENVSKFSKLLPEELFDCTLMAIDHTLIDDYNFIKECINEIKNNTKKVSLFDNELVQLEKVINNLNEKKMKYENLKNLLEQVKLYRLKKYMLSLEKKKKELLEVKKEMKLVGQEKENHFNKIAIYLKEIEKGHTVIEKLTYKIEGKKQIMNKVINELILFDMELEKEEKKIVDILKKEKDSAKNMLEQCLYITEVNKKKKKKKKELNEKEKYVTDKENSLQNLEEEAKKLEKEINELSDKHKQLRMKNYITEQDLKKINEKIKTKQNYEKAQKEKMLSNIEYTIRERICNYERNIKEIIETYHLLSHEYITKLDIMYEQSVILSKKEYNNCLIDELSKANIIYGPLCKYIKCIKPQYDYIVEFFFKKYFTTFLLVNTKATSFLEALYKKYKLSVITISTDDRKFCHVTNEMKKQGVEYFLHEIFDSPDIIKKGLSKFLPLNVTFIVNEKALQNKNTKEINMFNNFMLKELSKQLKEDVNNLFYFSNNGVHQYKISNFDKHIYTDNLSYIKKKKCNVLYHITEDIQKNLNSLYDEKTEKEKKYKELKEELKQVEQMRNEKNNENNKIILQTNEIPIKKHKIELMKEELNELEKSWTDFLDKSKNLKNKKKEI